MQQTTLSEIKQIKLYQHSLFHDVFSGKIRLSAICQINEMQVDNLNIGWL